MRTISILLVSAIIITSCSSAGKTISSSVQSASNCSDVFNPSNDGPSYEEAVLTEQSAEREGVPEEYKSLKEHYPGNTFLSQSLRHKEKGSYDVLHTGSRKGEGKDIYFDITGFFGKF